MSYEVSILWFKAARGAGVHWSIFIKETHDPSTVGTKHDCMCQGQPGRGFRWVYSTLGNYSAFQSRQLGGKVIICYINDKAGFEKIMQDTPLPVLREGCQSWCWKVFNEAVRQGIVDQAALNVLGSVPTVGAGLS
jgi:hypothetical protein